MSRFRPLSQNQPAHHFVKGIVVKDSDVPLLLHKSLKKLTLSNGSFQTHQVRDKFLCRLMSCQNLTRICLRNESIIPLSEFSRKLIKSRPPKLCTLWLQFLTLTQNCLNLLAVVLRANPQLRWLELFEPWGERYKYSTIIALGVKLEQFQLVSLHEIPEAELFLISQGLLVNDCKLESMRIVDQNVLVSNGHQ